MRDRERQRVIERDRERQRETERDRERLKETERDREPEPNGRTEIVISRAPVGAKNELQPTEVGFKRNQPKS